MKKKYLIATHGEMANGLQSSLIVLADKGNDVTVINAYVTDDDFTPEIVSFVDSINENQQGIIFTDLFGGSVNQKVVTEIMQRKKENIFVISNTNLAIILSLLFVAEDQPITNGLIESAINESQVQLVSLTVSHEEDSLF